MLYEPMPGGGAAPLPETAEDHEALRAEAEGSMSSEELQQLKELATGEFPPVPADYKPVDCPWLDIFHEFRFSQEAWELLGGLLPGPVNGLVREAYMVRAMCSAMRDDRKLVNEADVRLAFDWAKRK